MAAKHSPSLPGVQRCVIHVMGLIYIEIIEPTSGRIFGAPNVINPASGGFSFLTPISRERIAHHPVIYLQVGSHVCGHPRLSYVIRYSPKDWLK